MDMNTPPPFQMFEVYIGDTVVLSRPVHWDGKNYDGEGRNEDGEYIKPIAWQTTCPHCGQLVHVYKGSLCQVDNGKEIEYHVKCASCNIGKESETSEEQADKPKSAEEIEAHRSELLRTKHVHDYVPLPEEFREDSSLWGKSEPESADVPVVEQRLAELNAPKFTNPIAHDPILRKNIDHSQISNG